jgi:lysophospholipase L1-like esterase
VHTYADDAGSPLITQWDWGTGESRFIVNLTGSTNIRVFCGDGSTNGLRYGTTPTASLPVATDTEVLVSYDGTGSANADRLKIFTRPVGGAWVAHTLTFSGTIPATIPATTRPLEIGHHTGFTNPFVNAEFWDVRWFKCPVTPIGSTALPLAGCVARWRFTEHDGTTSTGEIGGLFATLTSSGGAGAGPVRVVDGWQATTPTENASILLAIGDSKTDDVGGDGSAFRGEMINALAARGIEVACVGRYVDSGAPTAFEPWARHSGLGGIDLAAMAGYAAVDVALFDPDVVVLEGGTNDIVSGGFTAAQTRDRMGLLIDAVLLAKPGVPIVVMTDPIINNGFTATQAAYNALLPALVALYPTAVLTDPASLMRLEHLSDTLHPNLKGYRLVGAAVAAAVASVL